MATAKTSYRKIDTSIWEDPYILDLTVREKFFFVYLLTNSHTTQSGIYEIPLRKMEFETSFQAEEILSLIKKFQDDGKMIYSIETKEICIINWLKYNENKSPKTMIKVYSELEDLKNPFLLLYLYDPRLPLYDGEKTLNRNTAKESKIPYIIENPWKDTFKNLSDAELIEIRKVGKIDQNRLIKPHGYSIDTVSILHPPYTYTEHIHNITDTKTETKTEPFPSFSPEEFKQKEELDAIDHFTRDYNSEYEKLRLQWNDSKLPQSRQLFPNISNPGEVMNSMSLYTFEEIEKAIENYNEIKDRDRAIRYSTFVNFLVKGIEKYADSGMPFDNFKDTQFKNNKTDDIGVESGKIDYAKGWE